MAKKLRQRLSERAAAIALAQADQRALNSWMQGLKFEASQKRGQAALNQRKAAKKAGRAKARDIFLKEQA